MCEICGVGGTCLHRCPNYIPPKAKYYCCFCEDGIYDGQDYMENYKHEYAHWDCIDSMKDLAEWLGVEIQIMYDEE